MLFDPKWKKTTEVSPTKRLLMEARKLIASPDHWCQGSYNTKGGRRCAVGALAAIDGGDIDQSYELLLAEMGGGAVSAFNDTHTHEEVIAAFDRAIAAAR